MKDLSMIACISKDGGLGNAGELLWHIPEDLKFFREITTGRPVVMGSKTFASIGRPLPSRQNIVLTRHPSTDNDIIWIRSMEELKSFLETLPGEKFIIGGASLYKEFLPLAKVMYLTEVDNRKPADTYFPEFNRGAWDYAVLRQGKYQDIDYRITKYIRKEEQ